MKYQLAQWHRWIGIGTAFFLAMLCVTGLYLNHSKPVLTDTFQSVVSHPFRTGHVVGITANGLAHSDDNGHHWQPIPVPFLGQDVRVLTFMADQVVVGFDNGRLLRGTYGQWRWQPLITPEGVYKIKAVTFTNGNLLLLANNGLFESTDSGESWTLLRLFQDTTPFGYWMYQLHTGQLFWPYLVYLNDAVAVLTLVLIGTGLFLFFRRKPRP